MSSTVFVLQRFMQYRDRSVYSIKTEKAGKFIAIIFDDGEAEIYDLRRHSTAKPLRLKNVVDLCFMKIDKSEVIWPIERNKKHKKVKRYKRNSNEKELIEEDFHHGLLIARQSSMTTDEFIRLGYFFQFTFDSGWSEVPISVDFNHSNSSSFKKSAFYINEQQLRLKPFEIALKSVNGFIVCSCKAIVVMVSEYWSAIYVWRTNVNAEENQVRLQFPLEILLVERIERKLGSADSVNKSSLHLQNKMKNEKIYKSIVCMLVTECAIFASDGDCILISPASAIQWNGYLSLNVSNIIQLQEITSHLVAGVDQSGLLFIFGVDASKHPKFVAYFVMVKLSFVVEQCVSMAVFNDGKQVVKKNKVNENIIDDKLEIGWTADSYLLVLKVKGVNQMYTVLLNVDFIEHLLFAKKNKKKVEIDSYSSKMLCTVRDVPMLVMLFPDMILMPNGPEIHAYLMNCN